MKLKDKIKLARNAILDKERKNLCLIIKDLNELRKENSLIDLKFYFRSLMYKKDAGDIHKYVNDSVLLRILKYNSRQGNWILLANKIRFVEKMSGIPNSTPLYLGKIENSVIYDIEGNSIALENKADLLPILDELIQNHKVIFVKSAESCAGKGIFRFNKTSPIELDEINLENDYLIEKGLIQHEALNKINPHCINTLRVITLNRDEKIQVTSCLLRMGVNDSHNDNASTGGIFIGYDIQKNKLNETATKFIQKGGTTYHSHPQTKYIFKDQPLPYPNEVISLVTKAAKLFPERYIIGWDVAYTPQGPVIIEGNTNPCPVGMQIAVRGLRNVKIYDDLYREFYN